MGNIYFILKEFFHISGKVLSVEWIGHLESRVVSAGGSEADANYIYEEFHNIIKFRKLKARREYFIY